MFSQPDSPWNPDVPVQPTPREFELQVRDWLARSATDLWAIEVTDQGEIWGAGGEYAIDVLVRLALFGGAEVIVLAECKHQRRPVARDQIHILEGKLRDARAHKGILFSTSGFQGGAIKLAAARGIATITVRGGEWLYGTRSFGGGIMDQPQCLVGERMQPDGDGFLSRIIAHKDIAAIKDFLEEKLG
jgi:restriction system protein